jgi:hypothetical protein
MAELDENVVVLTMQNFRRILGYEKKIKKIGLDCFYMSKIYTERCLLGLLTVFKSWDG